MALASVGTETPALPGPNPPDRKTVIVATRLPHHPSSVAKARRAVDELDVTLEDDTVATLRLLISELVTNSVKHSLPDEGGDIELSLWAKGETVRVEVADSGTGFAPQGRGEDQDQGSGWGLHLLEILSSRWGTERERGMRIWFEIDGSPVAAAA